MCVYNTCTLGDEGIQPESADRSVRISTGQSEAMCVEPQGQRYRAKRNSSGNE
jgi:hypothetical protein